MEKISDNGGVYMTIITSDMIISKKNDRLKNPNALLKSFRLVMSIIYNTTNARDLF